MSNNQYWSSKLRNVKFCPWCGCETLDRDQFCDEGEFQHKAPAFWCRSCLRGFSIDHSARVYYALNLLKFEKQQTRKANF
jgi:hypothetical protein